MLKIRDNFRGGIRAHVHPSHEIALLAKHQVGFQVGKPLLLRDLMNSFSFVFFITGADIGDLDIPESESQEHAGGFDQCRQFDFRKETVPLLLCHPLIPGRENHRNDRNAQAFIVNIEHDIDAFRPELSEYFQQLILVLQGGPSDKDRMRILELQMGSL